MRTAGVVLLLVVTSVMLGHDFQSQPAVSEPPAILGNLAQGTYSNTTLGIKLELPVSWQIQDLNVSIEDARQNPGSMHLQFRSNEDWILLFAAPVAPGQKLTAFFGPSLASVADSGDFQKVGSSKKESRGACPLLRQELKREQPSGPQLGVYRGFFSQKHYIYLLQFGPAVTEASREGIIKSLQIQPDACK